MNYRRVGKRRPIFDNIMTPAIIQVETLVYFEKMDGTQLASVEIAQSKARTAVLFRRPSKAFADQYAAGNRAFTTFPEKPVASEGGVPIIVDGKIIGAIGASGGTD